VLDRRAGGARMGARRAWCGLFPVVASIRFALCDVSSTGTNDNSYISNEGAAAVAAVIAIVLICACFFGLRRCLKRNAANNDKEDAPQAVTSSAQLTASPPAGNMSNATA